MRETYERVVLDITAFDREDVIMTSGYSPEGPITVISDGEANVF